MRIGLTGKPKIGKSTIIRSVIQSLNKEGIPIGGMLTTDIQEEGARVGFSIEDISTRERGILAHIHLHQRAPKVGKYFVNRSDLDSIGVNATRTAVAHPAPIVIIVDEIGPMELNSKKFIHVVEEAIDSGKSMLVSVHLRSEHDLVKRVKREFEMFEVTAANRDEIADHVIQRFCDSVV